MLKKLLGKQGGGFMDLQWCPSVRVFPSTCSQPDMWHCAACRYFYISVLYNVCYTLALYGLILFWSGASELLQPFNPLLKFVLVKTVVFLTFWQVRAGRRWLQQSYEGTLS
jgi:hypothetical protein